MDMAIDAHVGVREPQLDHFVRVVNPVRETLQIDLQSEGAGRYVISLLSMDGRILASYQEELDEGPHQLRYPFPFGKGAYLVCVQRENGSRTVKKLVGF